MKEVLGLLTNWCITGHRAFRRWKSMFGNRMVFLWFQQNHTSKTTSKAITNWDNWIQLSKCNYHAICNRLLRRSSITMELQLGFYLRASICLLADEVEEHLTERIEYYSVKSHPQDPARRWRRPGRSRTFLLGTCVQCISKVKSSNCGSHFENTMPNFLKRSIGEKQEKAGFNPAFL